MRNWQSGIEWSMWNSTDIQNMYPVRTLNFKGGLFSGPKTSEANWVSYGDFVVFHFWESWFVMNHSWQTGIGWIKLWQYEFSMIPITRTLGHSKNFLMIMNQDDHHFIKKLYFVWINIFLSIDRVMMGLIIVLMIGLILPQYRVLLLEHSLTWPKVREMVHWPPEE